MVRILGSWLDTLRHLKGRVRSSGHGGAINFEQSVSLSSTDNKTTPWETTNLTHEPYRSTIRFFSFCDSKKYVMLITGRHKQTRASPACS